MNQFLARLTVLVALPAFPFLLTTLGAVAADLPATGHRARLIVMADMGNEPDEEQQMAHLLMYANQVDLEGLIACSGKYLHADRTDGRVRARPDLFHRLADGYAEVVENLHKHESGWPTAGQLRSIIKAGTDDYGIEAVKPGRVNEATELIMAAILKKDPRKLYIVGNAGTNTLAQALVDLATTRSESEMDQLCAQLIVFENGAQDNSGAWIAHHYPKIAWHRSNHQAYAYGGPEGKDGVQGPYTWEPYPRSADGHNDWAVEHIMTGHGVLGGRFPPRLMKKLHFIEGGGTIPWMGLVKRGLGDEEHLDWGGWSGRFSSVRHKNVLSRHQDIRGDEQKYGDFHMFEADSEVETWTDPIHQETFTSHFVPVWRFRRAMFNDFRARMDWCVKEYDQANHAPQAVVNGNTSDHIIRLTAEPGDVLSFDASGSTDPDNDVIRFHWWNYTEAGPRPYGKVLANKDNTESKMKLSIPADAAGKQLHVILEVWDQNDIVPMVDYRRVVIEVGDSSQTVRILRRAARSSCSAVASIDAMNLGVGRRSIASHHESWHRPKSALPHDDRTRA